jgi:hypothetical protein
MRNRIFLTNVTILGLVFAIGCSSDVKVPASLLGIWQPADSNGIALQFKQDGPKAEVFYAELRGVGKERGEWIGPLPLEAAGDNVWTFQLEEVRGMVGKTAYTWEPPDMTHNIKYGIDKATNRVFVISHERLKKGHHILVSTPIADTLLVHGLWIRVDIKSVKEDLSPKEADVQPLTTKFIRSN